MECGIWAPVGWEFYLAPGHEPMHSDNQHVALVVVRVGDSGLLSSFISVPHIVRERFSFLIVWALNRCSATPAL